MNYKKFTLIFMLIIISFVTFNFVNIAWVFFRAKEWNDAIKVLYGMFGGNGVMVSDKTLYKVSFLRDFITNYSDFFGRLQFGSTTFIWCIVGTIIVVKVKNSFEISNNFQPNYKNLLIMSTIVLYTLFDMNKISEFLYFNF